MFSFFNWCYVCFGCSATTNIQLWGVSAVLLEYTGSNLC